MATDEKIQRARAQITERLRALDAEATSLRAQLASLDAALELAERYSGVGPYEPAPVVERTQAVTPSRKRPRNPSHEEVGDVALQILSDASKPMTRDDLFDAVTKAGLEIEGQDPKVVFSTMMWRERERVVNLKGFGYWPADRAYEPAGHAPMPKIRRRSA